MSYTVFGLSQQQFLFWLLQWVLYEDQQHVLLLLSEQKLPQHHLSDLLDLSLRLPLLQHESGLPQL